jgi:transcriptional regulator with XRE-family HTH domain
VNSAATTRNKWRYYRVEQISHRSYNSLVLDLSTVRQAAEVTQMELAAAMNTTQGQISRIERQSDMLLSTLSSYLAALGVNARLVVDIDDETITYNLTA